MEPPLGEVRLLTVEVLARGLTGGGPPRLSVPGSGADRGEAYRLFHLLDRLQVVFGGRVAVYLVEPFSLTWIARIIRHRPRRYPAFILGGREVIAGLDEGAVLSRVEGLLGTVKEFGRDE
ncbi:MAG: hypothetical protein FJX73_03100 [Armatimonadetes bacterium]|nr:hypothetical protein [Armatimonadota bacterium]